MQTPAVEDYLSSLQKMWTDIHERLTKLAEADRQQADKMQQNSDIGLRDDVMLSMKHLKLKAK